MHTYNINKQNIHNRQKDRQIGRQACRQIDYQTDNRYVDCHKNSDDQSMTNQ